MGRLIIATCATLLAGMVCAAEPARPAWPDTLHLKKGTVLPCRIDAIGTDGKVRFRTPLIDGAVSALPAHVKRLEMTASAAAEDAGALALILTNDDRVAGRLVELTDDVIVLDSPTVGEVEIPRPLVRCIMSTSGGVGAVWSDFRSGLMEPWRSKLGTASVKDGALQASRSARGSFCIVSVPLKQAGAMTIQAVVSKGLASCPSVGLWLYGSDWQRSGYQDGILAEINLGTASVRRYTNGHFNHLGRATRGDMAPNTPKATYTMAYDPERSEVKVWINAQLAGTFVLDDALPVGQEVAMYVPQRTHILRTTVRPGVHAPDEDGALPANKARVVFKNGDSWPVTRGLSVADERLLIVTPDGELRCPFENVACIDLPVGESAMPRRNKGDARVQIGRAILTMQITQMSKTTLRGRSDYLGAVRLPRGLVRRIEFDIYR